MNIICILWKGEFRGRDFSEKDVLRLYNNVKKYIDRRFTFYCLTNDEGIHFVPGVNAIPLKHDWPGWWSKVELHRPDLPEGRTLYLDLDSYIVNDLKPILDYDGDLVMFNTRVKKKQAGMVNRYQAATMLFTPGTKKMKDMYDKFRADPNKYMNFYRSEQDIMGEWMPNQPTFPDRWLLKLNECKNMNKLPEDCIIVTGQPKDISFRDTDKIPWLNDVLCM